MVCLTSEGAQRGEWQINGQKHHCQFGRYTARTTGPYSERGLRRPYTSSSWARRCRAKHCAGGGLRIHSPVLTWASLGVWVSQGVSPSSQMRACPCTFLQASQAHVNPRSYIFQLRKTPGQFVPKPSAGMAFPEVLMQENGHKLWNGLGTLGNILTWSSKLSLLS